VPISYLAFKSSKPAEVPEYLSFLALIKKMGCAKASKEKSAGLLSSLSPASQSLASPYNVRQKYIFERLVGRGHYGTVHLVSLKSYPKETYAIKAISKKKVRSFREMAGREISILQGLDHPNVLKLIEVHEDARYIYLVTEYCSGGSVLDWLQSSPKWEKQAASLMSQIFQGLQYLHINKVCHRDLKPENCMFASKSADSDLKIIDFGLATRFQHRYSSDELQSLVGTPSYQAPEVLQGKYGPKCDMWSAGVIMLSLLSAKLPFEISTSEQALEWGKTGLDAMRTDLGRSVSVEAQDLVSRLLVLDPGLRLEPKQALEHPWFSLYPPDKPGVDIEVVNTLKTCQMRSHFQRIALNSVVKSLKSDQIAPLTRTFRALDRENNGFLTSASLKSDLSTTSLNLSLKSLEKAVKTASTHRNGKLSYSDFLSAAIDSHGLLSYERIQAAFSYFDRDSKGTIGLKEVFAALERQKWTIDVKIAKKLQKEFESWPNGLSFDAFRNLLRA